MSKETIWIVAIAGVVVVLVLWSKKSPSYASGAAPNVGPYYAPSAGVNDNLAYIGAASGVLSQLFSGFGGGSGGSNDPGLLSADEYAA
jgi:hypothetical protein